jgi:pSer/pThr/pTyr-binding forkhead associated (FHA) protein
MPNIKVAHLTVIGGIWDGTKIPLTGRLIVLGRHWQNDIVIKGPTVSRRHAYIVETPRGVVLRDLNSANGTYVNGGKIGTNEHVLRSG